ncbi:hypothetical protein CUMW_205460 [Citrus unshiu]|uniref:Uncharacterized protein n=1 Tax=Citrus unshiu TaxID=55188 RepID=A0A2H5Q8A1_CITUN|nr:hypothetical protein CUMW_205460 [Citrus unshiu]
MPSNTSCKVIHLQVRVLLPEDGHDATIGMPKSLVVLVVGLPLQVLDLSSVGVTERFELSLIHSLLPLQLLLEASDSRDSAPLLSSRQRQLCSSPIEYPPSSSGRSGQP